MFRRLASLALFPLIWLFEVAEHRRTLGQLGEMDDRALADIGLTRQDLRDVTALPLSADPTLALAARAAEREALSRRGRRRSPPPPPAARMAAE
jgi:uncharacterized protein YjiS (DUF1127 family)